MPARVVTSWRSVGPPPTRLGSAYHLLVFFFGLAVTLFLRRAGPEGSDFQPGPSACRPTRRRGGGTFSDVLPNTASSELDEYLRLPFTMSHPSSDSSSNFEFVLQHFSRLKSMFGDLQMHALIDYVQAALMLTYNNRKVG